MPGPKSKISRSKRGMRRSHNNQVEHPAVQEMDGQLIRPHRAYKGEDGAYYYKGKQISAATEVE